MDQTGPDGFGPGCLDGSALSFPLVAPATHESRARWPPPLHGSEREREEVREREGGRK